MIAGRAWPIPSPLRPRHSAHSRPLRSKRDNRIEEVHTDALAHPHHLAVDRFEPLLEVRHQNGGDELEPFRITATASSAAQFGLSCSCFVSSSSSMIASNP